MLDTSLIARRKKDRLVDTETTVLNAPLDVLTHVANDRIAFLAADDRPSLQVVAFQRILGPIVTSDDD